MKSKHVVVVVERSAMEKTPLSCYLHEVLLLKALHGASNVSIADDLPNEASVDVVAAEEYSRLAMLYGNDPKTSLPYVERAFGIFDDAKFTTDVEALLPAPAAKAAK